MAITPNVLLIVLDDIGLDMLAAYGEHPHPVPMPRLDERLKTGLRFNQTISTPLCSPTRATLLTGEFGFRNGIGGAIAPKAGWGLPPDAPSLPKALAEASGGAYRSAVIGKWHLSTPTMGGWDHPRKVGFDHHVGAIGNLVGKAHGTQTPMRYDLWTRAVDGKPELDTRYNTTATVDDALVVLPRLGEPWFGWVAFNAAHFPMHAPPRDLLPPGMMPRNDERGHYRSMIAAMDHEVDRLLTGLEAATDGPTWVLLMADNGSAPVGILPPWPKDQRKGKLLRGGVRVPLMVWGPELANPGGHTDALVNTTDLYSTVLDLAGLEAPTPRDSLSFAKVLREGGPGTRTVAYAEGFLPNGMGPWEEHRFMVRDAGHKLIRDRDGSMQLFDLVADPMERVDLLAGPGRKEFMAVANRLLQQTPAGAPARLP